MANKRRRRAQAKCAVFHCPKKALLNKALCAKHTDHGFSIYKGPYRG